MKLHELLNTYRNIQILEPLEDTYYKDRTAEDKKRIFESYLMTIEELRNTTPKVSESTITMEWTPAHAGEEGYWHISMDDENGEHFCLDFIPWDEVLGMNVQEETAEFLAHVLWEITFYGFTSAKVVKTGKDMLQDLEDIKDGAVELEPWEAVKSKLGLDSLTERSGQ